MSAAQHVPGFLPSYPPNDDPATLRLIWPQWQGAGYGNAGALVPELPAPVARRGYMAGARALAALLPPAAGPTATVPVDLTELAGPDGPEGSTGGIESRSAILAGIDAAVRTIDSHPGVERILTIGGECSVSVAPFAWLANKYGDDLAVVWIDSHPDVDTPDTGYDGYHAMAVTALAGRGDAEVLSHLPSRIDPSRIAWAGLHEWEPDCDEHVSSWGITAFGPDDLRVDTRPLIDWLHATGASRLAIHFDVDTIDADEVALGLGRVSGGLTAAQVHRLIADLGEAADVVGLTVAEYLPRELLALGSVLAGLPLVTG
ncbi:arginase family protein [Actinomyces glycerinitolerans]|uniref:arginase family protein n=1 Tax=Actinomyces glycerinitolerans TaxID=1892869 RepID=UPI001FCD50FF|nr:arginase family protein [Actinomyces glycerinitolerans]